MDEQPKQRVLGPIKLANGVTPREVILFLIVVALAQVIVVFLGLLQPFVFSEILHIPAKQQGRVGGAMASVQQSMLLIFVSFAGALADRWGRKAMLILALIGFAISAVLFPLVSSLAALTVVRAFFGFSQNGHTAGGPTKMFDYPDNGSRGKFMGLTMLSLNIATIVLVGMVGSHLLSWLQAAGFSAHDAGRDAFWMTAGLAVLAGLICAFGLRPDHVSRAVLGPDKGVAGFIGGFRAIYRYALGNPSFALIMITGFVIRTDQTVLQSFVALWVVNAGHAEGLSTAQGIKTAGALTAIQSGAFLIVPFIVGYLLDRVNRTLAYGCAMGFAGVSLICTVFVHDVSAWPIYVVMGVVGFGEAAQTLTQQALFGQEAPPHLRGTAYGVFAFTGTFSVVVITAVSGFLFDKVGYTAPFVLAGLLHLTFLGVGVAFMRSRKRRLMETLAPETAPSRF